ncbi:MAG TPA: hypothetical protein VIV57_00040 [Anaeromyxobacter sp.]
MRSVGYTVTEANGLRTYRCGACGSRLTYLVENVEPALLRSIDDVARRLSEMHCRGGCRRTSPGSHGDRSGR